MKLSATRRALILANIFNSLVAIYFIIIAIVGLVQLRWYHQLTTSVKVRHVVTLTTSYFAFFILILVGLLLLGLFIQSALRLTSKAQQTIAPPSGLRPELEPHKLQEANNTLQTTTLYDESNHEIASSPTTAGPESPRRLTSPTSLVARATNGRAIVLRETSISEDSQASTCCSILLHLLVTIGLIGTLLIWLFNTGELVREAISTQLDYAFARYQFSNRSNHYSIAVDGMQDINNCCGSLDYSDFPHQRVSGLSSGHYPGSCCGKNVFGVNARVLCTAEEVHRARQTSGCTTVLANHYDLISLLVVPVALVCLFVNITIIALITISRRGNMGNLGQQRQQQQQQQPHLQQPHPLSHHQQQHHNQRQQQAFAHLGDDAAGANSNNQNRLDFRRARRQQEEPPPASPHQSTNAMIAGAESSEQQQQQQQQQQQPQPLEAQRKAPVLSGIVQGP